MLATTKSVSQLQSTNVTLPATLDAPTIRMYTTTWCPDCFRAKKVMDAMKVTYAEVDITTDEEAAKTVLRLNNGYQSVPTIVFPDGSVLTEPPAHLLVQKLKTLI